jgi:succinate dehydrogenase flavin-adding protein (antitoxin of CptAB toxin-antitoxin module)
MANDELSQRFATFLSGYGSRWMEARYDKIMLSPAGRRLMNLDQRERYVVEAGPYALMSYVQDRWTPESPLLRAVKKAAMDAPPEVAKRLVNGFREQAVADMEGELSEEKRQAIATLLALDDEDLFSFTAWMASASPEQRKQLVRGVHTAPPAGEEPACDEGALPQLADEVLSDLRGLRRTLERRQRRRDRSR